MGWRHCEGNTLKVKPRATQVTYTYDCGNGLTAEFALTVKEATTGCTYIPLNAYNFPDQRSGNVSKNHGLTTTRTNGCRRQS